jgi:hypothetical protein
MLFLLERPKSLSSRAKPVGHLKRLKPSEQSRIPSVQVTLYTQTYWAVRPASSKPSSNPFVDTSFFTDTLLV